MARLLRRPEGLPLKGMTWIFGMDGMPDRARTFVNVIGGMWVRIVIAAIEGELILHNEIKTI
jgi:Na+/H+-dicarboxylate symporter